MTTWNKAGTLLGSLSEADIKDILAGKLSKDLKWKLLTWFQMAIEKSDLLWVTLPYKGKASPTIEE